jgi:hypothetical protein
MMWTPNHVTRQVYQVELRRRGRRQKTEKVAVNGEKNLFGRGNNPEKIGEKGRSGETRCKRGNLLDCCDGCRVSFTESKTRSWRFVRADPGPFNDGLCGFVQGLLRQDARGRCASILSIRQTPLCVRWRSRRCVQVRLE